MDWVHIYSAFSLALLTEICVVRIAAEESFNDKMRGAIALVAVFAVPYLRAIGVI